MDKLLGIVDNLWDDLGSIWWIFYDILDFLRILVDILILRCFGSPILRRVRYAGYSSN